MKHVQDSALDRGSGSTDDVYPNFFLPKRHIISTKVKKICFTCVYRPKQFPILENEQVRWAIGPSAREQASGAGA